MPISNQTPITTETTARHDPQDDNPPRNLLMPHHHHVHRHPSQILHPPPRLALPLLKMRRYTSRQLCSFPRSPPLLPRPHRRRACFAPEEKIIQSVAKRTLTRYATPPPPQQADKPSLLLPRATAAPRSSSTAWKSGNGSSRSRAGPPQSSSSDAPKIPPPLPTCADPSTVGTGDPGGGGGVGVAIPGIKISSSALSPPGPRPRGGDKGKIPEIFGLAAGLVRFEHDGMATGWLSWRRKKVGYVEDGCAYDGGPTRALVGGHGKWGKSWQGGDYDPKDFWRPV
ncbi:hypothetical protein MKZ38_000504 [Zalerion maritima]|uniref:Uncharacterized protein n=1 Tax=Zalerion maritima TaxID=339359 RepID=A0AAD5RSW1_9PEZI|nr:hypothetical protein MKZ38_000504 [Zalerion maritima]